MVGSTMVAVAPMMHTNTSTSLTRVVDDPAERRARQREERTQRCTDAWISAIALAGQKVATARDEETLFLEIRRLDACRQFLEGQKRRWYGAPKKMPPKVDGNDDNDNNHNNQLSDFGGLVPSAVVMATSPFATQNPFAAFEDYDDDEDEDEEESTEEAEENNDEDPAMTPPPVRLMTMRRLLVRVLTTLSELHARVTNMRRHDRDDRYWTEGVDAYAEVVECLHAALLLADEEYGSLYPAANDNDDDDDDGVMIIALHEAIEPTRILRMHQLGDDAQVVMIALEHATRERQQYEGFAARRLEYLQNRLAPQWESRDEVKARLGRDRWENNPRPKNDYSQMRKDNERELRALEVAMGRLETIKSSLDGAYKRSQTIYKRVAAQHIHPGEDDDDDIENKVVAANRYNDLRSPYHNIRVPFKDYPDPTMVGGWTFTGSIQESYVEFFEKELQNNDGSTVLVKLDWYYSTATIKTSMDHPTKGPNQLFGKQVSPHEYRMILQNPRAHTDVRYRTRSHGGGRGRGRASRGRNKGFGRGGR
ncbi:expressed unknown protein [Seminavis robusta]|uniref:Uncharacterized protein n=1 Tax=Seminavis robusta TaxID=568900 RepID=A0A9N8HE22_9STRA|nr:expressed unknown protein [Seminavis robusta]|eukprot:Sro282_g107590.1 n/a (536) ;mRNA; r:67897-69676